MKNIITILLISCIATFMTAQGQENDGRRFTGTIVGGMNLSQIEGDAEQGFDKVGLNIGAKAGAILAERWELGFEILFSQQGSQSEMVRGIPRLYYCNLNYIEVPILVTFKDWQVTDANNRSFHRFQASLGLSYNRLMGGRLERYGIIEFQGAGELVNLGNFRQNHIMLMGDVNFYITRNWGVNIRFSQAPMNIRTDQFFNPRMLVLRALFTL
jgi:hypothetical protein